MDVNLKIDDALLRDAQRLGEHRSKEAADTAALRENIQRRKQLEIIKLFGKIDYDSDYDYKRHRWRSSSVLSDGFGF